MNEVSLLSYWNYCRTGVISSVITFPPPGRSPAVNPEETTLCLEVAYSESNSQQSATRSIWCYLYDKVVSGQWNVEK